MRSKTNLRETARRCCTVVAILLTTTVLGCPPGRADAPPSPAPESTSAVASPGAAPETVTEDPCPTLSVRLCADLGEATKTCQLVRARSGRLGAPKCLEMLGEYDKVLADLERLDDSFKALSAEVAANMAKGDSPSFGPKDAKVVVVEYADFQCRFSAEAAEVVQQIKKRYGKVIRFVFRQYPLPSHPDAMLAAQASLAAHQQGEFWPYHDLLFASQGKLARKDLERYALQAGLRLAPFRKALDEATHESAVKADVVLGDSVQVMGTPTIFVGRHRVENTADLEFVSRRIDRELEAAGVEIPARK